MKPSTFSADSLLQQMTLDEKIAQMGSYWVYELKEDGVLSEALLQAKCPHGIGQISRVGGASGGSPVETARTGNQIQKFLVEKTRLGIPALLHEESCLGAVMQGGTTYPQMLGVASTFQPEWAEKMTTEIRKQLLAVGGRHSLSPVLDVSRDPRWGRIEETFGEDPTLVANFGVAYVRGLQGELGPQGVLATGKHFIGHSLSMGGLNCGPVQVGMHEIYDLFSMPFQAAIRDAGVLTMMNAYPELDGEVVAASKRILVDFLRKELGFDGLIVSDYEAIKMIKTHHYMTDDLAEAARLALEAGIEVELPSVLCYGDPLKQAVEAGRISIDLVDQAVLRHLDMKIRLGLFDQPYVDEGAVLEVFDTPLQRELAKQIALKSMVLLKNDGILPLPTSIRKLAVIGPNADAGRNQLGDYSYAAMRELSDFTIPEGSGFGMGASKQGSSDIGIELVSVLQGIQQVVSPQTELLFAKGCEVQGGGQEGFAEAIAAAEAADAVVLVLGDCSGLVLHCTTGEFRDCADLKLAGHQRALAEAILAVGKPVAVVLINGRPYEIEWLDRLSDAILEAWLPGEEGGTAVAETLFGLNNPGGKLPLSYPRSVGQLPLYYNHKKSGQFSVPYRKYVDHPNSPLYPFGHGLSYTEFAYRNFSVSQEEAASGEVIEVAVMIHNIGPAAGDEVVQLYSEDEYASCPRPVKELRGYQRIHLEPGESKQVIFQLNVDQLAFINNALELVLEAGSIKLMIGSSSEEIHHTALLQITETKPLAFKERVFDCPVVVKPCVVC